MHGSARSESGEPGDEIMPAEAVDRTGNDAMDMSPVGCMASADELGRLM
jgi:hypothetical protein